MSIEFVLIGTGLGLGLRHGVDFDHIAAITDITGAQPHRGKAIILGTLYALGHAFVVAVLGTLAILFGSTLPESMDKVMELIVGVTLVALGIWLFYSLWDKGADYQLRSRWMLVFVFVRRGYRWADAKLTGRVHAHPHESEERRSYGRGMAYGIGMIHGIGAETGSQALLLAAAAGATSSGSGSVLLIAFMIGLVLSNSMITVGSVLGFWGSRSNRVAHIAIGVVAATFSLAVGLLFLFARSSVLPSILS